MTDQAIISGDYVDLKFIKSRKVCQIIVEVPIEAGSAIVQAFGTPQPHEGVPVALARLEARPKPAEQPKEISRAQRAGMLCGDARFQKFAVERFSIYEPEISQEGAAKFVREFCGVNSRSELDNNEEAGRLWDRVYSQFQAWLQV